MKKEIISRTIVSYRVAYTFMDSDRSIKQGGAILPAHVNTTDKAEKFIRRVGLPDGQRFICVDEIHKHEELRGMYIEDFLKHASQVLERSKETRDCVTKEVKLFAAEFEYLSPERKPEVTRMIIPAKAATSIDAADKHIRKDYKGPGKFIGTVRIISGCAIYALAEAEFIKHSKPMLDRFHLAD